MSRAIRLNPYGNKPGKTITRNAARAAFVGTPARGLRAVRMRDGEEDFFGDGGGDSGGDDSLLPSLSDFGIDGDATDITIDTGDIDPTDILGPPPQVTSNVDQLIDVRQQIEDGEDTGPGGGLAGGGGTFGGEPFQQTGAVDSNKGESWFGGASGKAGPIAVGIGGGALVGGGIGALVGGKRKRLMGAGIGALVGVLLGGGGAYLAVGDK